MLQFELAGLKVYGETSVGWDACVPVNAPIKDESLREKLLPDPSAPKRRVYNDLEVNTLREKLRKHNGIHGLEICEPHELQRIAQIFRRDGFVVVRNLLNTEQLNRWRDACAEVLQNILSFPGPDGQKYETETGRLPHRYSYGSCSVSGQMLHHPVWVGMIDLPTTLPIITEIFGSSDYNVWGAGGDICLPGAIEYQHLHHDYVDLQHFTDARIQQAKHLGIPIHIDREGRLTIQTQKIIIEMTPPVVTINFAMSDITPENGPIRQIPGSHSVQQPPPIPECEPDWMKYSTFVGVKAGDGIFRDIRAWHGATPNVSREIRALPNVEYGAPWWPQDNYSQVMPHEIFEALTPHAQKLCERIKAENGQEVFGSGFMHPLASKRAEGNDLQPANPQPLSSESIFEAFSR